MKILIWMMLLLSTFSCNERSRELQQTPDRPQEVQGVRTGSGGDAIACYDSKNKIDKVYLWDFVEAIIQGTDEASLGDAKKSEEENLEIYFDRIFSAYKETLFLKSFYRIKFLAQLILKNDSRVIDDFKLVQFINKDTRDFQVELLDIKDDASHFKITNQNCKRVQVARTEKESREGSAYITIDYKYYSLMPTHHKAALIIHETMLFIYNMWIEPKDNNSVKKIFQTKTLSEDTRGLRNFIRQVATNQIPNSKELQEYFMSDNGFYVDINTNYEGLSLISENQRFKYYSSSFLLDDDFYYYENDKNLIYSMELPLSYQSFDDLEFLFPFVKEEERSMLQDIEINKVSLLNNEKVGVGVTKSLKMTLNSGLKINVLSSKYVKLMEHDEKDLDDDIFLNKNFLYDIDTSCGGIKVLKRKPTDYDVFTLEIECIGSDITHTTPFGKKYTFPKGSNLVLSVKDNQSFIIGGVIRYNTQGSSQKTFNIDKCRELRFSLVDENYISEIDSNPIDCPKVMLQKEYLEKTYKL